MPTQLTINDLNRMDTAEFVQILADIFEHSAWVAEGAVEGRPFANIDELHSAMVARMDGATLDQQLGLLRAHPELAGRVAQSGELTDASTVEQASAKLDALSISEMAQITDFNRRYQNKFSFPFIIAVLNHSKQSIFSEFERRLRNAPADELKTALEQVGQIARFRLAALLLTEA